MHMQSQTDFSSWQLATTQSLTVHTKIAELPECLTHRKSTELTKVKQDLKVRFSLFIKTYLIFV